MSIESVNERELLSAAMQGSQVAYRELIHLHQAAIYRFAWAMAGDEDAQTITENAFITAWRQLEEGKGDFAAPGEKRSRRPRFAFGRFSIIGLCIALVLLAYSNSISKRNEEASPATNDPPSQSQVQPPQEAQQPIAPPPENGDDTEPEAQPRVGGDAGENDEPEQNETGGQDDPAILPGGGETGGSSTLVPAGETYAAVSIVGEAGSALLNQYSSLSFRANLADGRAAIYYVVPSSNAEALDAALAEAAVSCTAYGDEPEAIDAAAERMLYIVFI